MKLGFAAAAVAAALAIHLGNAGAVGTLVPAAGRVDMVHDAKRDVIYITDGGSVLRYHEPSGTFLDPITLGGQLSGLDLSSDGYFLAVADRSSTATEVWVYVINLYSLAANKVAVPKVLYEDGTWAAAFNGNGDLFVSSRSTGAGPVPLRRFNTVMSGAANATELASVGAETMVSASGDRKLIGFSETNISDGRWGSYQVPTATLSRHLDADGTGWLNRDVATSANGSQLAIATTGGTFVYGLPYSGSGYSKVAAFGQYAGPQPVAVAYHPVENQLYLPWSQSSEVRVFDARSLAQVGSFDFEENFQSTGSTSFEQGRTRLSLDGSLLMVSVTGGVRIYRQYAPLAAAPVSVSTIAGRSVQVPLQGSIGNGGQLSYGIALYPGRGSVSLSGATASYTPAAGFAGADSFRYRANYGAASAEAAVSVTVINNPPAAVNDSATTKRNTAVTVPVLANDSDPDGHPVKLVSVSQVVNGTASVQGSNVVFTPTRNFTGTASFSYSIADGYGGTASATATVTVTR